MMGKTPREMSPSQGDKGCALWKCRVRRSPKEGVAVPWATSQRWKQMRGALESPSPDLRQRPPPIFGPLPKAGTHLLLPTCEETDEG